MRILHVIPTLDPATGGPPAVAARLAAAQAGLGYEVALLSADAEAVDADVAKAVAAIPHWSRVRHVRLRPPASRWKRLLASEARRALAEQVAVAAAVHIHGVWSPLNYHAATTSQRLQTPYIVRPAGMLDPWSLAQKWWKKRLALAIGYRRMLDAAAWIHVLNADEDRLMAPLRVRAPRVVIPNGVFLEEIEPLPERGRFRAAHPEVGDDPFVLFLSRLHYKKGLDHLAEAFASLAARDRRVRLVVAGPDEGARTDFAARVAAASLESRVHLVGPLYGAAKYEAMVEAACFCLPSRQEGFSVAIVEALAVGLPVVISAYCHFPDVAEVGAGVVAPLEAGAIAAGLESILSDEGRRSAMSAAASDLVRTRYTWPAIAAETVRHYERTRHDRS